MVKKPARAGHNYLDAAPECLYLRVHAHTAEDCHTAQPGMPAKGIDRLMDLRGQLTRGGEDQCPNLAVRSFHELLEKWKHKRRCLAGSCLGQAQDITLF
jgi:hypothetical protein